MGDTSEQDVADHTEDEGVGEIDDEVPLPHLPLGPVDHDQHECGDGDHQRQPQRRRGDGRVAVASCVVDNDGGI
jgi:hypothetical protein